MIPKRKLKNKQKISVIGAGGLMFSGIEQKRVDETVEIALQAGVNFFDVAPTYGDSEIKLGRALSGKREKVLLSCKTTCRDGKGTMLELEQSLRNLKTDHFDFYVMHGIRDIKKDVEPACSEHGMLETAIWAKEKNIVRSIGFSAHTEEAAMFALDKYEFDFLMFPINLFCYLRSGFGSEILNQAGKRNIDTIGIKVLALEKWHNDKEKEKYPNCWYRPLEDKEIGTVAIQWALSQSIVSFIPPADIKMFRMALELVNDPVIIKTPDLNKIKKIADSITPIFP